MKFINAKNAQNYPKQLEWLAKNNSSLTLIYKNNEYTGHLFAYSYGGIDSIQVDVVLNISKEENTAIFKKAVEMYKKLSNFAYLSLTCSGYFDSSKFNYDDRDMSLIRTKGLTQAIKHTNYIITKNVPTDLVTLLKTAYNYDKPYDFCNYEEQAQEFLESRCSTFIYILDENEQKKGIIICEEKDDEVYIEHICVLPKYRKMGVASDLLNIAFKNFKNKPFTLDALESNQYAQNLYKKYGFKYNNEKNFAIIINKKNL